MIEHESRYFDPEKIYLSGQVLLGWERLANGFRVTSAGRTAEVRMAPDYSMTDEADIKTIISCPDHDNPYWSEYFDLRTDYGKIEAEAPDGDAYLSEALEYGRGIRILRQNLWECLCSFIVSQNNNIPRITKALQKIRNGHTRFPEPETLFAEKERLCDCGLGYRDIYLVKLAEEVHNGSRSLEFDDDTEVAYKELLDITGVGPKVANCVLLFGLHRMERCPVDTWMKQVFERRYGGKVPEWTGSEYAGYYQQVTFFYERTYAAKKL